MWLAVSYAGVGNGVGTDEGELAQAGFGGGPCLGASRGEISMGGRSGGGLVAWRPVAPVCGGRMLRGCGLGHGFWACFPIRSVPGT